MTKNFNESINIIKTKHINNSLELRRTPTRLSDIIGKYSFLIKYDGYTICERINVLDFGIDLYQTERGKRVLKREINKSLNLNTTNFKIVF
jgi:hypothetical protein